MDKNLENALLVVAQADGYEIKKASLMVLLKMDGDVVKKSLLLTKYYEQLQNHDNFITLVVKMEHDIFTSFNELFKNPSQALFSHTDKLIILLAEQIILYNARKQNFLT